MKVAGIPRHDRHPVHESRGSDHGISFRVRVGHMQPGTPPRDRYIDGKHAIGEGRQDAALQPSAQQCTLREITMLNQEDASLKLEDGDHRQELAGRWYAYGPRDHMSIGPSSS